MTPRSTKLAGLVTVDSTPFVDERGSFVRFFCRNSLMPIIGDREIVQINHSTTRESGTVRGLHFQLPPHTEMKLVRCVRGRVFDVSVDMRADSPTLYQWHAEILSADNGRMMAIPEGFAHGFQVLEPDSELLYLHTCAYRPQAEAGLNPCDPRLAIDWRLPVTGLSTRDREFPMLTANDCGLVI